MKIRTELSTFSMAHSIGIYKFIKIQQVMSNCEKGFNFDDEICRRIVVGALKRPDKLRAKLVRGIVKGATEPLQDSKFFEKFGINAGKLKNCRKFHFSRNGEN